MLMLVNGNFWKPLTNKFVSLGQDCDFKMDRPFTQPSLNNWTSSKRHG